MKSLRILGGNMQLFKADYYTDHRGDIINAMPFKANIQNVMYITGKEGAVRGNHVHKKDMHYCLVIEGTILYEWVEKGEEKVNSIPLEAGDIVLSETGEKHRFVFKTDGVFLALATEPRTHESYESDTIRQDF